MRGTSGGLSCYDEKQMPKVGIIGFAFYPFLRLRLEERHARQNEQALLPSLNPFFVSVSPENDT